MTAAFDKALALVLLSEGGKVDLASDPGGRTNEGVTQAVFTAWLAKQGKPSRAVYLITADEVSAIYKTQYADTVHFDDLPAGLDYVVFDGAVNSGPVTSAKWLQSALGVTADGHIGLLTLAAAKKCDAAYMIGAVCDERIDFLKKLSTWSTFGKGWTNRVVSVRSAALAMAAQPKPAIPPISAGPIPGLVLPTKVVAGPHNLPAQTPAKTGLAAWWDRHFGKVL